ncbi:MAG TPA: DUF4167 domain-containing protein [Sphingomicrobium sp.]|nr:DUF4167 domain-containing protein [Sphingomicrobium sp.]
MINNRQGGRRRGRGGQRGPNLGGQPGGNRQDNRQRGNAAQLLEKYKSMARDSQLAGDRVQSEYYLQFADHYFRVLGESRARFEDQRRQRGDDGDEDDGDEDLMEAGADDGAETNEPEPHRERVERPQRGERRERSDRGDRERHYAREDRSRGDDDGRNGVERGDGAEERIAMDVLPPAIGREDASGDEGEEEAVVRPRRRTRRPRAQDGEGEIAPAA